MTYSAKILADSIGTHGCRLTTMAVTFPRIVLAEFNTHRVFSRNSASSRAIPIEKQIQRVVADPFIPIFRANQKGMQPGGELKAGDEMAAKRKWLCARDVAIEHADHLAYLGVHKQWVNRLLEPFMWHTVIVSSTEWDNFFNLRCHPDAQDEIRIVARLMRDALNDSEPNQLAIGEWHLPYSDPEFDCDVEESDWPKLSAGRCARVSYLTHDGKRSPEADLDLFNKLAASGHWSPMEHAAMCMGGPSRVRNFVGWNQLREFEEFKYA